MLKKIKMYPLSKTQMQLVLFFGFVILGSLYANLFIDTNLKDYSLIIDFLKNKIQSASITKTALFEFILLNRLKMFLVLWIVGFTVFAIYVDTIVTAYFGFSFGMIFSLSLLSNGVSSYFFLLLLLVPQYIIYIPLYIYLTNKNSEFSMIFNKNRKISKSNKINGPILVEYIFVLVICFLFVVIGAFFESFVNIEVVRWYFLTKIS